MPCFCQRDELLKAFWVNCGKVGLFFNVLAQIIQFPFAFLAAIGFPLPFSNRRLASVLPVKVIMLGLLADIAG